MATKAELASQHAEYSALVDEARAALDRREIERVLVLCKQSWPFVDGMLQYERRFLEQSPGAILAIEMVLFYAPLLLDSDSLDRLEELLRTQRRIVKNATLDMMGQSRDARHMLEQANQLWKVLREEAAQAVPGRLSRFINADPNHGAILKEWIALSVVDHQLQDGVDRPTLSIPMDEVARGKCPACGAVGKSRKEKFWGNIRCPKCKSAVTFVIIK